MLDVIFNASIAAFQAEPLKVFLGGGGVIGVVALAARWWRAYPRVSIRFLRETYDPKMDPNIEVTVCVELENTGRESTSLRPSVSMCCLFAEREKLRWQFALQEEDRTLLPVTPKAVTVRAVLPTNYVYSHFRVFTFTFSRGFSVRMRIVSASGTSANIVKFYGLLWAFRMFGWLPHVRD